jgi:ABC-type transporter Mla subunit MlaD
MEVVSFFAKVRAGMMVVLLIATSLYFWKALSPEKVGQIYKMYFEDSVSGLEKNAAVLYNGIQVGIVIEIKPFPTNYGRLNQVKIRITSDESKLILSDAATVHYLTIDSYNVVGQNIGLKKGWVVTQIDTQINQTPLQIPVKSHREYLTAIASIYGEAYKTHQQQKFQITLKNLRSNEEISCSGDTDQGEILITFKDPNNLEKGTRASLQQNFVTGIKWVELSGGNDKLLELPGVESLENDLPIPEILVERGFFAKLTSEQNMERILGVINNVENIIENTSVLTSDLRKQIPPILEKVDHFLSEEGNLTQLLKQAQDKLNSLEKVWSDESDLQKTLANLQNFTSKLNQFVQDNGDVPQLLAQTQALIENLNKVATEPDSWLIKTAETAQNTLIKLQNQFESGGKIYASLHELEAILQKVNADLEEGGDIHNRLRELGKVLRNVDQVFSQDFRSAMVSFNKAMNELYEGLATMTANPENFLIGIKKKK